MTASTSYAREKTPSASTASKQDHKSAELPRLTLSKKEAATSLGVSVDFFEAHIQPQLRIAYVGRRRLIPIKELERWLERAATPAAGTRARATAS